MCLFTLCLLLLEDTARKCDTGGGHTNFFAKLYSRVTHVDHFHLGASPDDGTVRHYKLWEGEPEIKCPYLYQEGLTGCDKEPQFCRNAIGMLKKNRCCYYQVQLQIVVCDVHYSGFVVWTKQVMVINRIVTDEDLPLKGMPRAADPTLQDEHTLFYTDFNRPGQTLAR